MTMVEDVGALEAFVNGNNSEEQERVATLLLDPRAREDHRHVMLYVFSQQMNDHLDNVARADITCFRCGETGHKKQECRTWKTKICRHQNCTDATTCAFAHNEDELRTPWIARCIRVIRQGDKLVKIGCQRSGHTFRDCPYRGS